MAQIVYYFTTAMALGGPDRKVSFTVPTGNFGDIFAGYAPSAWACRSTSWSSPPTRTTSWRARWRPASYEMRGVKATTSPSMDIQISSNFERLLFEAYDRDALQGARRHGQPEAVRLSTSSRRSLHRKD
jgi:threonine synthase